MAAKVPGKLEEGDIFFAHVVQDADGALILVGKPNNAAPRSSELTLQGLHPRHRRVEMLLEKPLQDVHRGFSVRGHKGYPREQLRDTELKAATPAQFPLPDAWTPGGNSFYVV
jgi:hypothetical protein